MATIEKGKLEYNKSFWGLCLESGRRYSQVAHDPFHVSMAALATKKYFGADRHVPVHVLTSDGIEYLLCTLEHGRVMQVSMNLNFKKGEDVTFFFTGEGTVYLTGYLLKSSESPVPPLDTPSTSGLQPKVKFDIPASALLTEEYSEDDEDEDDYEPTESESEGEDESENVSEEEPLILTTKRVKRKLIENGDKNKKTKESPENCVVSTSSKPVEEPPKEETPTETPKKKKAEPRLEPTRPEKRYLKGGVMVTDLVIGHGQCARPGKFLHVLYTGRLPNKKVFDSVREGEKPLMFRLGKGEVIKGWDVALDGMRVGGRRTFTVPPDMGYGKKANGPIPANTKLSFTVDLKAVS